MPATIPSTFRRRMFSRGSDATIAWCLALGLAAVASACDEPSPPVAHANGAVSVAPREPVAAEVAPPHEDPARVDVASPAGPPTDLVPPDPDAAPLSGTIVEHVPAGGYHYLRVALDEGEPQWVVTMGGAGLHEGAHVRVRSLGVRPRFHSNRLHRDFTDLMFAVVDVAA